MPLNKSKLVDSSPTHSFPSSKLNCRIKRLQQLLLILRLLIVSGYVTWVSLQVYWQIGVCTLEEA